MSNKATPRNLMLVYNAVVSEPWLIEPHMYERILTILESHMTGEAHLAAMVVEEKNEDEDMLCFEDKLAVIRMEGVMGKRLSMLEKMCGGVDVDEVAEAVNVAANAREVDAILLDISSPGGQVVGTPELGRLVAEVRDVKPVVAYTDTQAASAAYWVMSQATLAMASESSVIGNVGVYMPVLDQSERYRQAGVKVDLLKAGKFKGMGYPGTSLTDEQRDHLKAGVKAIHAQFKTAVWSSRSEIAEEDMEGQTFMGKVAKEKHLVDDLGSLREAKDSARLLGKQLKRRMA